MSCVILILSKTKTNIPWGWGIGSCFVLSFALKFCVVLLFFTMVQGRSNQQTNERTSWFPENVLVRIVFLFFFSSRRDRKRKTGNAVHPPLDELDELVFSMEEGCKL